MTLYAAPSLQRIELDVVARIEEIRAQVRFVSVEPKAWARLLVPLFLAGETVDGSEETTAAGVTPDAGHPSRRAPDPRATDTDDRAFAGYRDALGYILQLHDDPHFVYHESLVRSLHYMMLSHDPEKHPGRWRAEPIRVHGSGMWEVLYEPPPPDLVTELMAELMAWLNDKDDLPAVVRAAMAHLNLVQIHPFADGNGRMGRALHTLVMVRDGILDPEFASIEKSIALDRDGYRESIYALGTAWYPGADARPFLRFCLTAHLHQAERALQTARRMSAVWEAAEREVRAQRLPERVTHALADAAFVGHVDPAAYRQWARVGEQRARADLEMLANRGLLTRSREKRRLSYEAGLPAREIRNRVWIMHPPHPPRDPFRP
jgi:Fic family protein